MARKTKVREHIRKGDVAVKQHNREIANKKASKGSSRSPMDNSYSQWERAVIDEIVEMIDISNSDAQGIVEAQEFKMQQSWGKGLSAKATAKVIDQESFDDDI